ncbi:hypothetical protein Plec18167_003179 [Paecilomyces lecythidis]|uniref:amidase n=1 Tax=Paecilomyces lecythidis TaxID=3004212 RepID=A0ABR3XZX1_9EURO
MRENWCATAARRRQEIYARIPEECLVDRALLAQQNLVDLPYRCGILTPKELRITEHDAVELLRRIRDGTYSAVEVTRAFCKRAAIAHQATNCLAWVMFREALDEAAVLDEYMRVKGKPKGPLHGLPISVKEHVYVAGTPATSGLTAWADQINPEDALLARILREAGAVFHVKTTNPQALMAIETDSNLFGRTVNPHNTNLTPGGSSGGEGALIAMRGSLLGIATDIGGSIRVPSGFSGVYGIKPSVARLPHGGLTGLHGGMENIVGVCGPMAACVDDLKLFCQVVLDSEPWHYEPSLVEIPWRTHLEAPKKLVIGVMWNDGIVQPHPPVTRALEEAVIMLRHAGHTIIEWKPSYHKELIDCINKAYFLDGGKEYRETMEKAGEPAVPIIDWILNTVATKEYTIQESWVINTERDRLRTLYSEQLRQTQVDAILCPVGPSVASAHDESRYWGYCSVFNALDFSAAVLPVSVVKDTDTWEKYPRVSQKPLSAMDAWYESLYDQGIEGPQKYRDAPISLQLVSRRFQEEKLLAVLASVDEVIRETPRLPINGH